MPLPIAGRSLDRYIGIPFDELNCYELFRLMYREIFGISLPSQPYHGASARHTRENSELMQAEAVRWIPVPDGSERFGHAVLLHLQGVPCHIGFVIGRGRMIHAQEKTSSCNESYRDAPDWRYRVKSFYCHPALVDVTG